MGDKEVKTAIMKKMKCLLSILVAALLLGSVCSMAMEHAPNGLGGEEGGLLVEEMVPEAEEYPAAVVEEEPEVDGAAELVEEEVLLSGDAPLEEALVLDGKDGAFREEGVRELFGLLNSFRRENDLPVLAYDADMEAIARVRARELSDSYSVTRPNGEKFNTVKIHDRQANAEKISRDDASDFYLAPVVFETLRSNPGHILSDKYASVGIACYQSEGVTYWALEFAKTAPAAPAANEIPIDAEHFPDESFRAALRSGVDTDGSGTLSREERDWVKTINFTHESFSGIATVQGIEYFPKLYSINVTGCRLSSLDVSGNPAMQYVFCSNNRISTITLGENSVLSKLECEGNTLRSLDISGCPLLSAAVRNGMQATRDNGGKVWYTPASGGKDYFIDADGKAVYTSARLVCDPNVRLSTGEGEALSIGIYPDNLNALVTGNCEGLYARVALVVENQGTSGLYVAQAPISADGKITLPVLPIPGIKVTAVNISLVRTLRDISNPVPDVVAMGFKYL